MNKKIISYAFVLILTLTIFQIMPSSKASSDVLLEIDDNQKGTYRGSSKHYLAQDFKTEGDEIWGVDSLSFYGEMGEASIDVGIKESKKHSANWLSYTSIQISSNQKKWHTFHIPALTLVPDKTYYVIMRVKSGNISMTYGKDQYADGEFYISTDDGIAYTAWNTGDLFLKIKGSEVQRRSNHYAVILSCGEKWGDNGAILLKNTINKGFWTEIKIKTDGVTKSNIQSYIDWLYSKSLNGDCTLLFYYAGHTTDLKTAIKDSSGNRINDAVLQSWFSKFQMTDDLVLIFETCFSGRLERKTVENNKNIFERFTFINKIFERIKEKCPRLMSFVEINDKQNYITTNEEPKENENYDGIFIDLVKPGRVILAASKRIQEANQHGDYFFPAFTYFLIQELEDTRFIQNAFTPAKTETYFHVMNSWDKFQTPQMADRISYPVRIK